ncbi:MULTISPECIES: hypothetical protein [Neobacillus]|jgi:hypothetical protein|uniref:DUF2500 domain-containing protein n=1 Tax=Neobacillus sedimentimangrovi TaxID=2699460 RepID=A0ABS8QGK9_9BACI|nr:hypothetical protein [Neobacillus sedimentimangrovi]AIM17575.1 hypothetical protein HW35_16140 [Bacillus sp. X1(2014)]MCD4838403.1 hypothetical protein [Neobacillus sedimentimangrovi]
MVTAIVIPIICIYFWWLTRKEIKEHDQKWLALKNITHEAVITGEIKDITEEKQRFYYHRYIFIQTLKVQSESKTITAKKITPITKDMKTDQFIVGNKVRFFGCWEGSTFIFNHYETMKQRENFLNPTKR